MRLKISGLILSIVVITLTFPEVLACSCGGKPTVQEAFEGRENVFIARIVSIEKSTNSKKWYEGIKGARMAVQKVFKGALKKGDEVFFFQGTGSDCVTTYDADSVGDELLIFENLDAGKQGYLGYCGRPLGINGAAEDLAYLENMDKLAGKTRVSGSFMVIPWYGEAARKDFPLTSKIKIYNDSKTYEVQTEKTGFYEIYDLPPGDYYVEPDVPAGYTIDRYFMELDFLNKPQWPGARPWKRFPIRVEPGRHTGLNFVFEFYNPITGKVIGPDGKPMAHVWLALKDSDDKSGKYATLGREATDEEGRFIIPEVRPGSYILYAHGGNEISANQPFNRLFYPGTYDREKAEAFVVPLGGLKTELVLKIPDIRALVEIKGRLIYSNGVPVAGEWIEFKAKDPPSGVKGDSRAKTNKDGTFILKLLKGIKGQTYPHFSLYTSDSKNCPPVLDVIKKKGSSYGWYNVREPQISIDTNSAIREIEIKLPFDGCKREETEK